MDTGTTFTAVLPSEALARVRSSIDGFVQDGVTFRIVREQERLGARKSEIVVDIFVSFGTGIASSLVAAAIYSLITSPEPTTLALECRVIFHEKVITLHKKKQEVITEIEMEVGKCR